MGEYQPVKGDRVRVVLEGEVQYGNADGFRLDRFTWVSPGYAEAVVSIEKIEPPVEVFKPGSLLRRKSDGMHYFVTSSGWTIVGLGYVETSIKPSKPFTSEHYEKVNLG